MGFRITVALILFAVFFSCNEEIEDNGFDDSIVIRTGTICGWCTVNDTLEIRGTNVRYVNYANCSNTAPAIEKKGSLLKPEFENLLKKLDVDELLKLELNSCNVCVDGCDNWIYYENNKVSHYIRFGSSEKKLEPIQSFVDQLILLKESYSTGN